MSVIKSKNKTNVIIWCNNYLIQYKIYGSDLTIYKHQSYKLPHLPHYVLEVGIENKNCHHSKLHLEWW